TTDFKSIKLKLASPEEILNWSYGEVLKPETINYRTQRPEKDSLFSERIFGPMKDFECYCGKYKRIRYKGIICDKCGVEVTSSKVRRERMGHITLAVPVAHIWFLRSVPSRIAMILGVSSKDLENVIYFASYIVTEVNEKAKKEALEELERQWKAKSKILKAEESSDEKVKELAESKNKVKEELKSLHKMQILSEVDYYNLSFKYGHIFKAKIGGEAIYDLLSGVNLQELSEELKKQIEEFPEGQTEKLLKRLKMVQGLAKENLRPEWMMFKVLPVLPPDLRPMVALEGGRYATSDLNDLYRRVINRNNRLKRLIELRAPEVITRNEKRMLQEAVDALIDNSARRGQTSVTASTGQRRALKSLADMLKGKQGRFRQNLLGKRVDYSGRSVIVVGPELKLSQCGLPKLMALELFKPFVIHELISRELAYNVRSASHLIERQTDDVWAILEDVIRNKRVLLNRAPTLHRLGIQAFQPVLIEGQAIRIHPMVCTAFNADFDGDQMAVHLPLTENAQREAREIISATKNLLKPSTGTPIVNPNQDIVLGCYFLTEVRAGLKGEGKIFSSADEAINAYRNDFVALQAPVKVRREENGEYKIADTTVGRTIFNQQLPEELRFVEETASKKVLKKLIEKAIAVVGTERTVEMLDKIKEIGFEYATISGISFGMDDLVEPAGKENILQEAEEKVETIRKQYEMGLLSRNEKKDLTIRTWIAARDKMTESVRGALKSENPVAAMIDSGARGDIMVLSQITGMKGPIMSPSGEIIELPIKNNFKKGLGVLEYFISTHGMRKGLVDTALKTARSGYLTRRLVDVTQDLIVREEDCKNVDGVKLYKSDEEGLGYSLGARSLGRFTAEEVKDPNTDKVIAKKNSLVTDEIAAAIDESSLDEIKLRSVITCKTERGVCQKCYGNDLGRGGMIKIGEAVGIVTAQAIGEPGTQLTMKTFHSGGIAKKDITAGLPRVEEIFEARTPKGKAMIADIRGRVKDILEKDGVKTIVVEDERDGEPTKEYAVSADTALNVNVGDLIVPGHQLTEGHKDLQELFKTCGIEDVRRYILKEIQEIYSMQGENLNDKHIEMIVKQMLSRVKIVDAGDTDFLVNDEITKHSFFEANAQMKAEGKKLATVEPLLVGISKASLSTDSFLSAASFQETQKILTNAAIAGKDDKLLGLKENVIIGRLIPAGTGFRGFEE
ncbi:MAG: DNA-directed RNA polymerase subunit beta', partial [bacterium]